MYNKICKDCGLTKSLDEFYPIKGGRYYTSYCKDCTKIRSKVRHQEKKSDTDYVKNRNAQSLRWNKNNRDRVNANNRRWEEANREHLSALRRKYRANWSDEKKQSMKEYYRQYAKSHPEIYRENMHNRRAMIREAFVEKVETRILYERDNGICGICGNHVSLTDASVDHIVPLSKGGAHSYDNTQISHLSCNQSKNNKFYFELIALDSSQVVF
jgi:HNH endonuclease